MKLIEIFDVFDGMNILKYMTTNLTPPWKNSTKNPVTADEAELIDYDYIYNHAGYMRISPMLEVMKERNMTDSQIQDMITKIIFRKYSAEWDKSWNVFFEIDYDPLENYDRREDSTLSMHKGTQETVEEEGTETNEHHKGTKSTIAENGSETLEKHKNSKEVLTDTRLNKYENKTYGFNSSSAVPSDEGTNQVLSGDLTTSFQDTDASNFDKDVRNFNNRNTTNTVEDVDATHFDKDVRDFTDRKTTRKIEDIDSTHFDKNVTDSRIHGNIGVTTSQQMGLSELSYRAKAFFERVVYPALDDVLTCGFYE